MLGRVSLRRAIVTACVMLAMCSLTSISAQAISAPIQIAGTEDEGVLIQSEPNAGSARLGWIPEGASPEYNCFTHGEMVGTVSVWFDVTHEGVTGYYPSFYDNSSYKNDAELTEKYRVPACGQAAPETGATGANPGDGTVPVPTSPPASAVLTNAPVQVMVPDPDQWCANSDIHRFDTQVREDEWIVIFKGVVGTPGQNNWRCSYLVSVSADITVPIPVTMTSPVDFRAACAEQFPGSRLEWVGVGAYPWRCVGAPGRYYPPPSIDAAAVDMRDGFTAGGLPASGPGSLHIALTGPAPTGGVEAAIAVVGRNVVLARGARRVSRRGRYALRIELTAAGRRALRRNHKLTGMVTVRFEPRVGRVTLLMGRITLR
jgi:hypothetical protein